MSRSRSRAGECRHIVRGEGVISCAPCGGGIVPMSMRTLLTDEQAAIRGADGGPTWRAAWPCHEQDRRLFGLTCSGCSPLTQEEADAEEADARAFLDRMEASLKDDKCSECGAKLVRSGTAFACPNGHVSGFVCGDVAIRDDGVDDDCGF